MSLVIMAKLDNVTCIVVGTMLAKLTLLSAAAPFWAGYTPDAYADIKVGPIVIRDAANLYMSNNTDSIVSMNGAMLKDWLEHAARIFLRLDPENPAAQSLLSLRVPTYNTDVIAGLDYEIDLSQPPRTNINGRLVADHALPDAAIPTLTVLGFMVGSLLAGAVVVESVSALLVAGTMVAANFMVDLAYGIFDPRIKQAQRGGGK